LTGGSFQYVLSTIEALLLLQKKHKTFEIDWYTNELYFINYFRNSNIKITIVKVPFLYKLIRKALLKFKKGFNLLRYLNKFTSFNPYFNLYKDNKLVYVPSSDSITYECEINAVTVIHDLMHKYGDKIGFSFAKAYGKKAFKKKENHLSLIVKFAKGIIVDSETTKTQLIDGYNFRRSFILPFIPPSYILNYKGEKTRSNVLKNLNIKSQYLFYPAQFCSDKNHINILKALVLLRNQNIKIHLVLVGRKHNSFESIKKFIKKYDLADQVYILGYVCNEDIIELYKNCLALIIPAFYGPTYIPITEAIYFGKPVVVSNIPELNLQGGKAALLVNPFDVVDISNKLKEIIYDDKLRAYLSFNANLLAEEISIDRFSNTLFEVIKLNYENIK